LKLNRFEDI